MNSTLNHHDNEVFHREHLGIPWRESEEDRTLRLLAEQYHERTEAYDRTVCTGPIINGSIMPVGPYEHSMINKHAAAVRRELGIEAAKSGFTARQWQDAVAHVRFTRRTKP